MSRKETEAIIENIAYKFGSPFWQIMQPLQLFAHFYPEFDHYWQFEMDTRFTSDVGKMLRSFHSFSTLAPYKQSRERASWSYMPQIHGSYDDFTAKLNETLGGGATVWGPVNITKVKPVGEKSPISEPRDDDFQWGVGRDADLVLLSPLFDVLRFQTGSDWEYKGLYRGFDEGEGARFPRFQAAPAQARASRTLLEAIHTAQHEQGLRIHGEATLPSFALWHGLKVVGLPIPNYQFPQRDLHELDLVHNGGPVSKFKDGIANGPAPYRRSVIEFYSRPRTWEWESSLTDRVLEQWRGGTSSVELHIIKDPEGEPAVLGSVSGELPSFMEEVEGGVYAPSMLLHPRKTNRPP